MVYDRYCFGTGTIFERDMLAIGYKHGLNDNYLKDLDSSHVGVFDIPITGPYVGVHHVELERLWAKLTNSKYIYGRVTAMFMLSEISGDEALSNISLKEQRDSYFISKIYNAFFQFGLNVIEEYRDDDKLLTWLRDESKKDTLFVSSDIHEKISLLLLFMKEYELALSSLDEYVATIKTNPSHNDLHLYRSADRLYKFLLEKIPKSKKHLNHEKLSVESDDPSILRRIAQMAEIEKRFSIVQPSRYEYRKSLESSSMNLYQNGRLDSYGKLPTESPSFPIEVSSKIIEVVACIRKCGWFANTKRFSDTKLALTLVNLWYYAYHEVLTENEPLLIQYLISMDQKRSWQRPIQILDSHTMYKRLGEWVRVRDPLNKIYYGLTSVPYTLGFGGEFIYEDSEIELPDGYYGYEVSYRKKKAIYSFPISPSIITPYVFTNVPDILNNKGKQIYFIELKENRAGITVITEEQGNLLEDLTGVSLKVTPPDWWVNEFKKSRNGYQT